MEKRSSGVVVLQVTDTKTPKKRVDLIQQAFYGDQIPKSLLNPKQGVSILQGGSSCEALEYMILQRFDDSHHDSDVPGGRSNPLNSLEQLLKSNLPGSVSTSNTLFAAGGFCNDPVAAVNGSRARSGAETQTQTQWVVLLEMHVKEQSRATVLQMLEEHSAYLSASEPTVLAYWILRENENENENSETSDILFVLERFTSEAAANEAHFGNAEFQKLRDALGLHLVSLSGRGYGDVTDAFVTVTCQDGDLES